MNNLDLMKKRLEYEGGNQEGRMIKSKYKTLQKALYYSYQAEDIKKINEDIEYRALINPDKNGEDYDDKIISIDYKAKLQPGDIIQWINTNTYWLVFLPELTENAYFRAAIRRCKYQLSWIDMDKEIGYRKITSYAYIRGPVETAIKTVTKNNIVKDIGNYSLEIYIPLNEDSIKYFKRYKRFAFNGKAWQVQAVDDITISGILKIIALEDYENILLDDLQNEKVTDGFYIKPIIEGDDQKDAIIGNDTIKPLVEYKYTISEQLSSNGKWEISNDKVSVVDKDNNSITIKWADLKSGNFILKYIDNEGSTQYQRIIIVESLF